MHKWNNILKDLVIIIILSEMCEANTQNIDMCKIGFSRSDLSCSKFQWYKDLCFIQVLLLRGNMKQIFLEILYFSDFFPLKKKKNFISEFVLVSELSIFLRVRFTYSTWFVCNFSKHGYCKYDGPVILDVLGCKKHFSDIYPVYFWNYFSRQILHYFLQETFTDYKTWNKVSVTSPYLLPLCFHCKLCFCLSLHLYKI